MSTTESRPTPRDLRRHISTIAYEAAREALRAAVAGESDQGISRVRAAIPASVGVPVAEVASILDVSQPTVRSWIGLGILEEVPGAPITEVNADTLARAELALAELRSGEPNAGPLARDIQALLEDQDIIARADLNAALAAYAAGETTDL